MHRFPRIFRPSGGSLGAVLCHLGVALSLAVGAAACGDVSVQNTTGAGGGGTGGDGGGAGLGGAGGEGGRIQPECDIVTAPHDLCGPSCPLTLDLEVHCAEPSFAELGMRVAPAPDRTYLAASSNDAAYVFDLSPAGGSALPSFPIAIPSGGQHLALDGAGKLHVIADETQFGDGTYPGGLSYVRPTAAGFAEEVVYDSNQRYTPPYDFDLAPDGTAHVWFATYEEVGTNGDAHGVRGADGAWAIGDANPVGEWKHFALDVDGNPVAFGYVEAASGYMLAYGPDTTQLGIPQDGFSPGRFRVTHAPAPSAPPGSVRFVAAIQGTDALHLAWPKDASYEDIALDGTAAPDYDCVPQVDQDPNDPSCPADCHEGASGLEYQAFAVARTADGLVWVAYVITHFDTVFSYESQCAEGYCWCGAIPKTDASTTELVVLHFTPGVDEPTVALTMPLPKLATRNFYGGMWEDNRLVDLRGFGSSVGLGIRLEDAAGFYARVMRFDPLVGGN